MPADPIADYLKALNTSDRVRQAAWDATYAPDEVDAKQRLQALPFSDDVRANLWDLRSGKTLAQPTPAAPTSRSLTDRAVSALPTAGGMAGGLLGGSKSNPVGIALAAIGGAGGEGIRQTLEAVRGNWDQVPPDIQSRLAAIVEEGVKQGGLEGAGRYIIGPLTQMVGSGIFRSALKVGKSVRDEFGGKAVTDTLVKAGVPITRSGSGTEKVAGLLKEAGQDTAQTIASAQAAGAKPVTMRPVAKALDRTRATVNDRALRQEPLERVQQMRDQLLTENPGQIPLPRAQAMKQAEQDLAIKAYQQEAKGIPVNNLDTSVHEDIARGLKEAIERRVPGIRNKNLRTQQLIGALKAISAAEGRIANRDPVGMGDALALGTAMGGYHLGGAEGAALGVLQEVLTRPEIASRLGIVLDRAGKPQITPQILRVVHESLNQAMSDDSK